MANVTVQLASFDNDAATFNATIQTASLPPVDGQTGKLVGLGCKVAATAASDTYAEAYRQDGSRKVTGTYLVGTDTSIGIGTTATVSIPVTYNAAHGRWIGYDGALEGPSHPSASVLGTGAASRSTRVRIVNGEVVRD